MVKPPEEDRDPREGAGQGVLRLRAPADRGLGPGPQVPALRLPGLAARGDPRGREQGVAAQVGGQRRKLNFICSKPLRNYVITLLNILVILSELT